MLKEEKELLQPHNIAENTHHVNLNSGKRRRIVLKQEATIKDENKGKLETYWCRSKTDQPVGPRNIHASLRIGEIKSSKTSDRQNTYIVTQVPPDQGRASTNHILERIQIYETLNRKENGGTNRATRKAAGHDVKGFLKEEKENLKVTCETPRKRKADETPAVIKSKKKHKGSKIDKCISEKILNSSSITPTAPALPIPEYAYVFQEQTDTDHPRNILPLPPVFKRLVDTGNDVEEVNKPPPFIEDLNPVKLDIPRLQEEKVI